MKSSVYPASASASTSAARCGYRCVCSPLKDAAICSAAERLFSRRLRPRPAAKLIVFERMPSADTAPSARSPVMNSPADEQPTSTPGRQLFSIPLSSGTYS